MYPTIDLFGGWLPIHTFGLLMSVAFVLFFWFLHRLSAKVGIVQPVFNSLIAFTLGIIVLGRIFYILAEWRDLQFHFSKFIDGGSNILIFLRDIFIMQNYNLSFMGGVIGFFIVFYIKTQQESPQNKRLYLDVIVSSFLAASIIGYIGALLGGQIYGSPVSFLGIMYSNPNSLVPFTSPVFPLPLFYAIGNFLIFVACIYLGQKHSSPGFIGNVGLALFGGLLLIGEFFNGSDDMFRSLVGVNLNQLGAFVFIIIGGKGLLKYLRV